MYNGGFGLLKKVKNKQTVAHDVAKRKENAKLRENWEAYRLATEKSERGSVTTGSFGQLDFLQLLRIFLEDNDEVPFNRAKVVMLSSSTTNRAGVIAALFGYERHAIAGFERPLIIGDYDSASFTKLGENEPCESVVMNVWDYSWRKVYKYFHYLFFTKHSVFIITFMMQQILDGEVTAKHDLKNLLYAKKLHAPHSLVFLVGEGCNEVSEEDRMAINNILQEEIIKGVAFNVLPFNLTYTYAPVDSESGENIDELKARISKFLNKKSTSKKKNMFKDEIPKKVHEAMGVLSHGSSPFLSYSKVRKTLRLVDINDDDVCEILLKVMSELGLITFLHHNDRLRRFIILRPEWLIEAAKVPIYKHGDHTPLEIDIDDPDVVNDFQVFCTQRVLTKELLTHTWENMDYSEEVHKYLIDVFESTLLLGDYSFDTRESFITPTFFPSDGDGRIDVSLYEGPYFVLDFSGHHTQAVQADGGQTYSSYLPFSFFEKLVSLCIQVSSTYGQALMPISEYGLARLSFGVNLEFILFVLDTPEDESRPLKVKVATKAGTDQADVNVLLERLFSMAKGIKADFYPGEEGFSEVVLKLLVPDETGEFETLADYEELIAAKESGNEAVWVDVVKGIQGEVSGYEQWTRDGQNLQVGEKVEFIPHALEEIPIAEVEEENYTHHVYLSYKESTGFKVIQRQYRDLTRLGYSVWHDKNVEENLEEEVYLEALKKSMCFMLLLSENVFESEVILSEIRTAIEENIPIIFIHHPDTDRLGYWTFDEYITSCPDDLKHLFDEINSIPLQRRFYLQEAVTNLIVDRIKEIQEEKES